MKKKSKLSIAVIAREPQTALFLSTGAHVYSVQNADQAASAWHEVNQQDVNYIFVADEFLSLLKKQFNLDLANHAAFISVLPNSKGETQFYTEFIDSLLRNAAGIDLNKGKISE